jgi:23S rRNA (pseudouridine1915-N3)-methyltransferase
MKITVASIGKTTLAGCSEIEQLYVKRLQGMFQVELQYVRQEKDLVAFVAEHKGLVILLDEYGAQMTSHQFSEFLDTARLRSENVLFVIGDAAGLPAELRKTSYKTIALSAMTFPHDLIRGMLLEQLYRAQTIIQGHPYHK